MRRGARCTCVCGGGVHAHARAWSGRELTRGGSAHVVVGEGKTDACLGGVSLVGGEKGACRRVDARSTVLAGVADALERVCVVAQLRQGHGFQPPERTASARVLHLGHHDVATQVSSVCKNTFTNDGRTPVAQPIRDDVDTPFAFRRARRSHPVGMFDLRNHAFPAERKPPPWTYACHRVHSREKPRWPTGRARVQGGGQWQAGRLVDGAAVADTVVVAATTTVATPAVVTGAAVVAGKAVAAATVVDGAAVPVVVAALVAVVVAGADGAAPRRVLHRCASSRALQHPRRTMHSAHPTPHVTYRQQQEQA